MPTHGGMARLSWPGWMDKILRYYYIVLRSYKHGIDGLYRVIRDEGPLKLMNGATMAASRATLVTIGQVTH